MSIELNTLKKGDIVKMKHDTFKVVDPTPRYEEDGGNPWFTAVRYVKTRKTYAKAVQSLRFNGFAEKI